MAKDGENYKPRESRVADKTDVASKTPKEFLNSENFSDKSGRAQKILWSLEIKHHVD